MQGVVGSKLSGAFIFLIPLPSEGEIRPEVRGLVPDAHLQGPGDRGEGVRQPAAVVRPCAPPEAVFRGELCRPFFPTVTNCFSSKP